MMRSLLAPFVAVALSAGPAPPAGAADPCAAERALPPDATGLHAPFDALLQASAGDGGVDYRCLKQHEAQLDRYLAALAETDPEALPRAERLALWINAYNAFTIKLVLGRYPAIKSIKEIPRRWDRHVSAVGGRRYSLDEIEHEILRKQFQEPRIHFAIACASKSCPDLLPEAYTADRLEEQLTRAARRFLADPNKGFRTEREEKGRGAYRNNVYLSSIFKWFRKDFESAGGSVIDFIAPYVPSEAAAFLTEHGDDLSIRFLRYDWSLNGRE